MFVQLAQDAGLSFRQRGFESRTRHQPPKSSRADASRGLQTGRNDWAAPEPVTGTFTCTELTDHATTNFSVIERFLPVRFTTQPAGDAWAVRVQA